MRLGCASDCTMAVHLIETSEEDSYLAVARHISDLLNEGQVSRRCLLASSSVSPSCSAPLRQATLPRSGKVVGLSRTVGPRRCCPTQEQSVCRRAQHLQRLPAQSLPKTARPLWPKADLETCSIFSCRILTFYFKRQQAQVCVAAGSDCLHQCRT